MPRIALLSVALALLTAPAVRSSDLQAQSQAPIRLELRVFLGTAEVTAETRITVHRAGERTDPIAQMAAGSGPFELTVPAGIYDVQAIRELEGRVANIRWAERLVVMPYPDESGQHLEVINFTGGFGALQIRAAPSSGLPEIGLYAAGQRDHPAASRIEGKAYALFVVPAGRYDVQVRNAGKTTWQSDIEVPLDRTRLWLLP